MYDVLARTCLNRATQVHYGYPITHAIGLWTDHGL